VRPHSDVLIDLLLTVSLEDSLPIDLLSAARFEKVVLAVRGR